MKTRGMVLLAALALLAALYGPELFAQEYKLTQQWELSGFDRPESALYDSARQVVYITNVSGKPTEKDGSGFISRISLSGELLELKWVTDLNAPKGMALKGDRLFVADIDRLVEVNVIEGRVVKEYPVDKAEFLNDVAMDAAGTIYVSDMNAQVIYRMAEGADELEKFVEGGSLRYPNGLYVEGDYLIVASWGLQHGVASVYGHLKKISLETGKIGVVGSGSPIGHLDGIQGDGKGNYFVTDWRSGDLLLVDARGRHTSLVKLGAGPADLDYLPEQGLLLIPLMNQDKVLAFKLE